MRERVLSGLVLFVFVGITLLEPPLGMERGFDDVKKDLASTNRRLDRLESVLLQERMTSRSDGKSQNDE
jgi:hypothetical protein